MAAIEDTVCRHPLNREVLYRMLAYCAEERALDDLEREAASWPEFETATQNQYRLAEHLVRAGGLDPVERDERGAIVMEQGARRGRRRRPRAFRSVSHHRSGRALRRAGHRPQARLVELLQLAPERADVYIELLEFVRARPRAYNDIVELLRGRPVLETVVDGERRRMQPSVFVDKLERSGALVWKEGWCLTEEGDAFLRDLKASE